MASRSAPSETWNQKPSRPKTLPKPLAATAGSTMKMAVKNASATPIVHPIAFGEICSSSGIC